MTAFTHIRSHLLFTPRSTSTQTCTVADDRFVHSSHLLGYSSSLSVLPTHGMIPTVLLAMRFLVISFSTSYNAMRTPVDGVRFAAWWRDRVSA